MTTCMQAVIILLFTVITLVTGYFVRRLLQDYGLKKKWEETWRAEQTVKLVAQWVKSPHQRGPYRVRFPELSMERALYYDLQEVRVQVVTHIDQCGVCRRRIKEAAQAADNVGGRLIKDDHELWWVIIPCQEHTIDLVLVRLGEALPWGKPYLCYDSMTDGTDRESYIAMRMQAMPKPDMQLLRAAMPRGEEDPTTLPRAV